MKDTDLITNIELKNSVFYYRGLEEKVLALVDQYRLRGRILFSSFSHVSVLKCKQLAPEILPDFSRKIPLTTRAGTPKTTRWNVTTRGKRFFPKSR